MPVPALAATPPAGVRQAPPPAGRAPDTHLQLPAFGQHTLETLRQPLEDGTVTISRASGAVTFPAQVTLVGAMNPCPCGYFGDDQRACTCSDATIRRYRRRLSGPLLDRIDIHLEVPRVPYAKLAVETAATGSTAPGEAADGADGATDEARVEGRAAAGARPARPGTTTGTAARPQPEGSAAVRGRVVAARERQRARLAGSGLGCNAELGPAEVRRFCRPEPAAEALLRAAMQRLHLSARAYHRVLKLARTIADLAGAETIAAPHVAEALQYRPRQEE